MNTAALHEMADDCGEWACSRVTAIELDRRIAEKCAPFPVIEAASACTELGFENEPAPRFAYLLAPAFDRWPRATTVVLITLLLALWGFAGQLDLMELTQ